MALFLGDFNLNIKLKFGLKRKSKAQFYFLDDKTKGDFISEYLCSYSNVQCFLDIFNGLNIYHSLLDEERYNIANRNYSILTFKKNYIVAFRGTFSNLNQVLNPQYI